MDGTGIIHYTEFLAATIEAHGAIEEDRVAEAFDRIDCDDSGYITTQNLRDFLGEAIPAEYLEEIIAEADLVNDHKISYEEFLSLWDHDGGSDLEASYHDVVRRRMQHASTNSLNVTESKSASPPGSVLFQMGSDVSENMSIDGDYWTGHTTYQSEKTKSNHSFDM